MSAKRPTDNDPERPPKRGQLEHFLAKTEELNLFESLKDRFDESRKINELLDFMQEQFDQISNFTEKVQTKVDENAKEIEEILPIFDVISKNAEEIMKFLQDFHTHFEEHQKKEKFGVLIEMQEKLQKTLENIKELEEIFITETKMLELQAEYEEALREQKKIEEEMSTLEKENQALLEESQNLDALMATKILEESLEVQGDDEENSEDIEAIKALKKELEELNSKIDEGNDECHALDVEIEKLTTTEDKSTKEKDQEEKEEEPIEGRKFFKYRRHPIQPIVVPKESGSMEAGQIFRPNPNFKNLDRRPRKKLA